MKYEAMSDVFLPSWVTLKVALPTIFLVLTVQSGLAQPIPKEAVEKSIFRIQTQDHQGTAILVALSEDGQTGTFLTAYHVLYKATQISIDRGGKTSQTIAKSDDATLCFADASREVAFVRMRLQPQIVVQGFPLGLDTPQSTDNETQVSGMAYGFLAEEQALPLHRTRVEFLKVATADVLRWIPENLIYRRQAGWYNNPGWMMFYLLGGEVTHPGMSGGPIFRNEQQFAGILYGIRETGFKLMIPAEEIRVVWKASEMQEWKKLADRPFEHPVCFLGSDDKVATNSIEWGAEDGLRHFLGVDLQQAWRLFQEVPITPPDTRQEASDLIVTVNPETRLKNEQNLAMWLDGKQLTWSKSEPIKIPLKDLPGESLLVIARSTGSVNDLELGKVLIPNKLDITFSQQSAGEERPFFRLVRSLPQIIDRYFIYVTIQGGRNKPAGPATSPANARLAVRLDFATAVLNQAPFHIHVCEPRGCGDGKRQLQGSFQLLPKQAWDLRRYSSQQIDVTCRGIAKLKKANYEGAEIVGPTDGASYTILGRMQFPFVMPSAKEQDQSAFRLYLSARATDITSTGAFRANLGGEFALDVSGVLQHLLVAYINQRLTPVDQPNLMDADRMRGILKAIGLEAPSNWDLAIRQAVITSSGDTDWLILTFRLQLQNQPGQKPIVATDLLSPPPGAEQLELTAYGVPGTFIQNFPALRSKNPLVKEAVETAVINSLKLRLQLPENWAQQDAPMPEELTLENDGQAVMNRLAQVLRRAADRGTTELEVSLRTEAAQAVLARALMKNDLKLMAVPSEGHLRLNVQRTPKDAIASLTLSDGRFSVQTPAGKVLDLGGDLNLRDATLTVNKLQVRGTMDDSAISAEVEAELKLAEFVVKGRSFKDSRGMFRLKLDTAEGNMDVGKAEIDAETTATILGFPAQVKVEKIPVTFRRDASVAVDTQRLKP